jgi:hypothetical protein
LHPVARRVLLPLSQEVFHHRLMVACFPLFSKVI